MKKPTKLDVLTNRRDGYHEVMRMADYDFCNNPPAYPVQVDEWTHASNRNELQVWDMFYEAANSPNPPGWLPEIMYSYAKYYDKRNQLTQGQWRVVMQIYVLLCWSDQLLDTRYYIYSADIPPKSI